MTIRQFEPGDELGMAVVAKECLDKIFRLDCDEKFPESYLRYYSPEMILERVATGTWPNYVAVIDGVIQGYAAINLERMHVTPCHVNPAMHRRGIATAMMKKLLQDQYNNGIRRITLSSSYYAHPFYLSVGFKDRTDIEDTSNLNHVPMEWIAE